MSKEVWMWLASGLGYGAVNSGELLSAYPEGAQAVADDLGDERLDEILTQKQAERLASTRPEDFALRIARAAAQGVETLAFDDPEYPDMLRGIQNPPLVLFAKGDTSLLNGQLSIGMVGARRPSAYGVEAMKAIGRGVAMGGAIVVSGLAAGLDAEAHKAALAVNGPTIACIAFGHDHCYPASNRKLMEVIERYGLVLSEYPPETSPEKPFFLHRNRLIAGLSHGLLVAEARRASGTMSTVNFATDYGRDVFAVPGSIFSELCAGTNDMIREGAYLAASPKDILAVYGIELSGEDPVLMAAKQASEGRPAPAAGSPAPWQQNLARQTARQREEKEQTLGEALQSQLGSAAAMGPVSGRQAVEAFRRLQQDLPPADGTGLDARNRALDEMVAAVNDSVELSDAAKASSKRSAESKPMLPEMKPEPEEKGRVRPFSWDKVEHLNKKEIERLRKAQEQAAQPQARAVTPAMPRPSRQPVEPVGRVERVERVARVTPVAPVAPAVPVQDVAPPVQPARQDFAPMPLPETAAQPAEPAPRQARGTGAVPVAPAPAEPVARPPSLAGKLRTLQPAAEPEASEPDPYGELSANARKAMKQLGPNPRPLSEICEGSGLSSGEAMAALTELELAGHSRQLAGRQFVIMQ